MSACSESKTPPKTPQTSDAIKSETPSEDRADQGDGPSGDDDSGDDHATPTDFGVTDLLAAERKASSRFERLAITGSRIDAIKTWKSETYAWAKLTYTVTSEDGQSSERHLYLACHFHGSELGCHRKDSSDASEPTDPGDLESPLPPIDGELPPIPEDF